MRTAILAPVLLSFALQAPAAAQAAVREVRGAWIPNTGTTFFDSREDVAAGIRALAEGGINVVFPVVWSKGYTLYPSAVLARVTGGPPIDPRYAGRDPLAEVLFEAHRHGLEVVPWFEYGFCAGHERFPGRVLAAHPDWAALDRDARPVVKNGFLWMNSLDPDVQAFVRELVLEVCRGYDVDGVQGDDRLPALPCEAGYDEATAAAWRARFRRDPPADCRDPEWTRWRADRLTDFLAALRDDVAALGEDLVFSMAPGAPGWAYREYLQDQETWLARDLVDALHPQVYSRELGAYRNMLAGVLRSPLAQRHRDELTPGVLVRIGEWRASEELLVGAVAENRRRRVPGEVFFYHQGLLDGDRALLRALRKGPYAKRAALPWRRRDSWRPPAVEAAAVALAGSWSRRDVEGRAVLELAAGTAGEVAWTARAATGGPHAVFVWLPAPAALPFAEAPAGPGWVRAGGCELEAGTTATVLRLVFDAPAGGVAVGPALVLPDRRRQRG